MVFNNIFWLGRIVLECSVLFSDKSGSCHMNMQCFNVAKLKEEKKKGKKVPLIDEEDERNQ